MHAPLTRDAVPPRLTEFELGDWHIEPAGNRLRRGEQIVHIEPRTMSVLVCLFRHAGEVVRKEQIFHEVWEHNIVTDQVLTHAIWQLRQVFGEDARHAHLIETIPTVGYRLRLESTTKSDPQAPSSWSKRHTVFVAILCVVAAMGGAYWKWQKVIAARESVTIVVLPFANFSSDAGFAFLSDAMTEETTAQITKLGPQFRVTPRQTAMTYKGSSKHTAEIARELKVRYVLEGSVRQEKDHVRITAKLIDAAKETVLWTQNYEQTSGDIILLETTIAMLIADEVRNTLAPSTKPLPPPAQ